MTKRTATWGLLLMLPLATAMASSALGYYAFPTVQSLAPDARGQAMGNAFAAVAEGANGVRWNPGGLGLVEGWSASPLSVWPVSRFDGDSRFRSYGLSGPAGDGGWALHYDRLSAGDSFYRETAFELGYGIDVAEAIRHHQDTRLQWGVGAAYKRLTSHHGGSAVLRPEARGRLDALALRTPRGDKDTAPAEGLHGWDLDLGTLVRCERPLAGLPVLPVLPATGDARPAPSSYYAGRLGLAFSNVLHHDMGADGTNFGRSVRAGIGAEGAFLVTPPFGHLLRLLLTFEDEHSFEKNHADDNRKYGIEATLLGILSWRYGEFDDHLRFTVYRPDGESIEKNNYRGATQGIGIRLGNDRAAATFDYARVLQGPNRNKLYTIGVHWTP